MLLLATSLKLLAEIALMALAGQGLLSLLIGERRVGNPVYRVLQVLTRPVWRLVRAITPGAVPDRLVPALAAVLLALVWLAATAAKITLCLSIGMAHCR